MKGLKIISMTLIILLLAGCGTTQLPIATVEIPPQSKNILSVERDGILINIDPINREWLESSEFNVISKDIIPVFVVIENRNSEPFFVPKKTFTLVKTSGEIIVPITTLPSRDFGIEMGAAMGSGIAMSIVFLNPALLAGGMIGTGIYIHNTERKLINLTKNELKEKALSKGESISGLVFFKLQKIEDRKKISEIQTKAMILRTGEPVIFSIPFKGESLL